MRRSLLFIGLFLLLAGASFLHGSPSEVQMFFKDTDQEFSVLIIRGAKEGKTLLVVAGIHGDERTPMLAVERYADVCLLSGTLILIPRLNTVAIRRHRRSGLGGDMNRLFGVSAAGKNPDARVVEVVKGFIRQSDCVLNLHQGDGFYSPTWIDRKRNPLKWGQSNVIDTPVFDTPDGGRMELDAFARRVVERTNRDIPLSKYYFHVNNTDTESETSLHKEQRKSLTYWAVTEHRALALGIESTRDVSVPASAGFLASALNAVMGELEIVPAGSLPAVAPSVIREELKQQRYQKMTVKVQGRERTLAPNGPLNVHRGDTVEVLSIEGIPQFGWYARVGSKILSGVRNRRFKVTGDGALIVEKDGTVKGTHRIHVL